MPTSPAAPTSDAPAPPIVYGAPPAAVPGQQLPGPFLGRPEAQALPADQQFHPGPFCRFCGSVPAVPASIRGHQGILVVMRFLKLTGPFCRTCGIAAHRNMTAKSLVEGWWGIASFVINPLTMLVNLPQRWKISRLAPPVPGAPGRPMDPGKPLYRRIAVLGFLVPLLVVGAIAFMAGRDADFADTGDCLHNSGTRAAPDVTVVDCGDPDADYRLLGKISDTTDPQACDIYPGTTAVYYKEYRSTRYVLCLVKLGGPAPSTGTAPLSS
ncbi:hypothetical protein [Kitasatospora sp. NPDC094015]|uniref:LppU/SCO3897 family protein n=1 Tax=Kitasatospora sp. NPDC094015 TaxID=3155205 RepID=UPI00332A8C00